MAARAEQEENHWPGFVDALSTIVMVVTFLLIILAIAIFVMSLRIANSSADFEGEAVASRAATNLTEAENILVNDDPVTTASTATTARVIESDKAFMLQFSELTIKLDDGAKERMGAYLERNADVIAGRTYKVNAYFDPSISYTKARRIAYYRLLSIRGALNDLGVENDDINIHVREAPTLDRIDAVELMFE